VYIIRVPRTISRVFVSRRQIPPPPMKGPSEPGSIVRYSVVQTSYKQHYWMSRKFRKIWRLLRSQVSWPPASGTGLADQRRRAEKSTGPRFRAQAGRALRISAGGPKKVPDPVSGPRGRTGLRSCQGQLLTLATKQVPRSTPDARHECQGWRRRRSLLVYQGSRGDSHLGLRTWLWQGIRSFQHPAGFRGRDRAHLAFTGA
jgi:hypothetical protein